VGRYSTLASQWPTEFTRDRVCLSAIHIVRDVYYNLYDIVVETFILYIYIYINLAQSTNHKHEFDRF